MLTLARASLAVAQPEPDIPNDDYATKAWRFGDACRVRTSGCGLVANRIESAWTKTILCKGIDTMSDPVRNNAAETRFELDADGHTAFAYYSMAADVITFRHTEVPPALEGHGIGSRLIRGALEFARAEGLKVVPQCPFVAAYVAKHAEFNDLLR